MPGPWGKVRRHWGEILRLIATIYTSTVSASNLVRALQRGGHPTALGEAIATYGRIHKTFHLLQVIDSEAYRRGIKGMRNLQEGRHALAEKIFHGRRRELFQRYREGMEDQEGYAKHPCLERLTCDDACDKPRSA